MPIVLNKPLYEKAKRIADKTYKKHSAFKSGFIVKTYKDLGGQFKNDHKPRYLRRWFNEKWMDVAHMGYPVYRPTVKVSKKTPLLPCEIDKKNMAVQSKLKQTFKGKHNLPPFQKSKTMKCVNV